MELFKTIQVFNKELKGQLIRIESYREELAGLYFIKHVDDKSISIVNPNGDIFDLEMTDFGVDGTHMEVVDCTNNNEDLKRKIEQHKKHLKRIQRELPDSRVNYSKEGLLNAIGRIKHEFDRPL